MSIQLLAPKFWQLKIDLFQSMLDRQACQIEATDDVAAVTCWLNQYAKKPPGVLIKISRAIFTLVYL